MSAPSAEVLGPAAGRTGEPRRGGGRSRSTWRSNLSKFDLKFTPYILISPFYVLFIAFGLFPLGYNLYAALHFNDLDDQEFGWAGLAQFERALDDSDFFHTIRTTFGLFLLSSVPQIITALCLAAILNRKLRMQTLLRMGVLLPFITPITASTFVFATVFAKKSGIANWVISSLGFETIDWRADTWSSWFAIITMVNWRWTGYWAIIFLAAMQSISKELYEAATIDGAGPWRQFWRLTVPLIRPAIVFAVVMSSIGGLQLFTEPLLFDLNVADAGGGADGQWQTVQMYIFRVAWRNMNLGYAAALSWILFLIIVVVAATFSLLTNRIGGRK
ncbi:MAG: sugar ABC transporter permease [Actinomycetales bacterium]|nr:sugar ABC transporter permease [Actinomycetales bacterium]